MVEAIITKDAVSNALSYGSLEKVRTAIVQLHAEAETRQDQGTSVKWTPQTENGYVGLDAPLG